MHKGLQDDNKLLAADSANIISLLRKGSQGWAEGELSGEKLRTLYLSLLENRFRLDEEDDTITFFR